MEPLDSHAEQAGRDLEVKHRTLGTLDLLGDPLVGLVRREIAPDVGAPPCPAREDLRVGPLAGGGLDRLPRLLTEVVVGPVVERDADDRAIYKPSGLEPVERGETHHTCAVAR